MSDGQSPAIQQRPTEDETEKTEEDNEMCDSKSEDLSPAFHNNTISRHLCVYNVFGPMCGPPVIAMDVKPSECSNSPGIRMNEPGDQTSRFDFGIPVPGSKDTGGDSDWEIADPPISDNWRYVVLKNKASELWVVTKSPYPYDWIKNVLQSSIFNEYKGDGPEEKFNIHGDGEFQSKVAACCCAVFCFENDEWDLETVEEVDGLSSFYGLKNVVILLSEKTPDTLQMKDQGQFPVLNFSRLHIDWYENNLKCYDRKMERMKTLMKDKGHKVGIFSRSADSDYEWLKLQLESSYFRDVVENVHPHYISNSGFHQFMANVSECSFGILYHTKNRGRINITDVTDSLYDEELDYMSRMLSKNVIVVVDDLQNISDEEKSRLQSSQPSVKGKALDLLLFSTEERKFLEPLLNMRNIIKGENNKMKENDT